MSDLPAALLLHGLLLAAGAGVLRLAGVRVEHGGGAGAAFALAGLSYLLGLVAVFAVLQVAVVLGVPFTLPVVLVVAAAFALPVGPAIPRAIAPVRSTLDDLRAGGWRSAPLALAVVLAGTFLVGVVANASIPLEEYDAWAIWTHKAVAVFSSEGLPTEVFASPAFAFAHPDYPLAMPLWEAAHFAAIGRADTSQVHVLMWLLLPAWIGGAVALAPRRPPPLVVVPVAASAGVLVLGALSTAYADAPLGIVLALAVLALGRWLLESNRSDLIVGIVLLGGAAQLKNEGVVGGAVVLLSLALAVRARPGGPRAVGVAALAWAAVFVAPWKVWLAVHGIHSDLPFGKLLDPAFLVDRAGRLEPTWRAMTDAALSGGLPVVPLVALVALVVARGSGRGVRAFVAVVLVGYLAGLVLAYRISPYDIAWHLGTSVDRVLVPFGMLGVSAFLLLAARAERDTTRTEPTSAPAAMPDR